MSSESVATYYYGVVCTGTPVHVDFSPSPCSASQTTDCNNEKDDGYSYDCYNSTLNASERLKVAQEIYKDLPVLLIDRFNEAGCETLTMATAYIADGKCYNFYENGGLTANITDDSANFRAFDENTTCDGSPSSSVTVAIENLNDHSCTESYSLWVRAYAANTTSSDSASASSSTSGTTSDSVSTSTSRSTSLSGNEANSESRSASADGAAASAVSPTLETGTIIGIVVAIVTDVAIAIGIGIYCIRSQRKKKQTTLELDEAQGYLWEDEIIVATRIPREKVVISTLLSRGGYGEVYKGSFDDQQVAIKMLPPHSRRDLQLVNAFLAEAKLMASLDHPHIVQFVGVAWNSLTDLCVVSELADNGDLRTMLDRYDAQQYPTGFNYTKIKIALHVAHALTYLHSLQPMVLHRDLKSKNIVLTHDMDAKLTDFGVSRERGDATMTAGVGTLLWMAPEVLLGQRYDEKAGIFSFGVVLSELDLHTLPYAQARSSQSGHKLSDTVILQMVSMGSLRVQFSNETTPLMEDLGLSCVSMDPAARPSAAEILHRLHTCLKAC